MKATRILIVFAVCLLIGAGGSFAHMGGHAPIDKETAITTGNTLAHMLTQEGKLPAAWSSAKLKDAKIVEVDGAEEWHLTYEAPQQDQTLYIFLSFDGKILGANFSGER